MSFALLRVDGSFVTVDQTLITATAAMTDAECVLFGVSKGTKVTLGAVEHFSPLSIGEVASLVAAASAFASVTGVVIKGIAAISGAGALLAGLGTLAACVPVRNAAGDYTITPAVAVPAGTIGFTSPISGGDNVVSINGAMGATIAVLSFNSAGAAADASFVIVLCAAP